MVTPTVEYNNDPNIEASWRWKIGDTVGQGLETRQIHTAR
jgi:hypothetical protein